MADKPLAEYSNVEFSAGLRRLATAMGLCGSGYPDAVLEAARRIMPKARKRVGAARRVARCHWCSELLPDGLVSEHGEWPHCPHCQGC